MGCGERSNVLLDAAVNDDTIIESDGPIVTQDGPIVNPDGPITTPDGPITNPDGPYTDMIYFDAPVHLHGHEMFVMGDLDRIAGLFDRSMWADICFEKWRQEYNPLRRYPTPEPDLLTWSHAVTSYPREMQDEIRDNGSVWLLTVSASKP